MDILPPRAILSLPTLRASTVLHHLRATIPLLRKPASTTVLRLPLRQAATEDHQHHLMDTLKAPGFTRLRRSPHMADQGTLRQAQVQDRDQDPTALQAHHHQEEAISELLPLHSPQCHMARRPQCHPWVIAPVKWPKAISAEKPTSSAKR